MAGGKYPGPTGPFDFDVQDGTMAQTCGAQGNSLCVSGHPAHKKRHRTRLKLVLSHEGKGLDGKEGPREGQYWVSSLDPNSVLLYDFAVSSSDLGSAHKYELDKLARRIANQPNKIWKMRIEGRASTTGTEALDKGLSLDREQAVHAYLIGRLNGVQVEADGVGKHAALRAGQPDHTENMFWRAVLVRIWAADKPIPPPPPPPPKRTSDGKKTKTFMIRVLDGDTDGISTPIAHLGGARDVLNFEIVDVNEKLICTYRYAGGSGSLGVGLDIGGYSPVHYMGTQTFQQFEVPKDWALDQIHGSAMLEGLGATIVGKVAYGHTRLKFSPNGSWHPPLWGYKETISDLDLGVSIQLPSGGGNLGYGTIKLVGKPRPYTGDLPQ
jgi:hypothetical protein